MDIEVIKEKINVFLASIDGMAIFVSVLWIVLFCGLFYTYNGKVFQKIMKIPTAKASLAVSEKNLIMQKNELSYLEKLNVDPTELSKKEEFLSQHFPVKNTKTQLDVANVLNQIALNNSIFVSGIQFAEEQKTEEIIRRLNDDLKKYSISDFYDNAWYIPITLNVSGDETHILAFMKSLESVPYFSVKSFSIVRNQYDLQYSIIIHSYYIDSSSTPSNT